MRLKITSLFTIIIMLFSLVLPLPIFADNEKAAFVTKDEVIYGKLHPNGQINDMYVVNYFYETTEGQVIDYGNYENLRNLTDLSPIDQAGDEVIFQSTGKDFDYQGELKGQQLPWHIKITYLLDGKKTSADQLAGKSGDLEIRIQTKENKAIDPMFFDYYLLQISLTFDPLYFQQITAPKGTEANEGKNKLINFSAMPGEEDVFIVTATVENLTLDPISISAVPANLSFDDPDIGDMEDDMQKLSDAIHELHDGVVELYDGVIELDDGTSELNKGSGEFLKGMQTINKSSRELIDGSKMIKDAFAEINEALDIDLEFDLGDIENLKELPDILRTMSGELKEFSKTLKILDDLLAELPSDRLNEQDIAKLYQALDEYGANNDIREVVNQLVATYTATEALFYLSENIPVDLTDIALEIAAYLDEIADELENKLSMLDELEQNTELIEGLQTMAN